MAEKPNERRNKRQDLTIAATSSPDASRSVLALSPIALSSWQPMVRSESAVLYGNRSPDGLNHAVVLYDTEQHALVARRVDVSDHSSSPDEAMVASSPRRCPLCNSDISAGGGTFVADSYFSTLNYMHRKLPVVGDAVNPFMAPPEDATSELRDISANLLVNGYYARFFQEIRHIGTGSFGTVYLCQHVIDSVPLGEFAVKKVAVGDSRTWLRGMMKEVKALERLAAHPNIVSYKHSWLEMSRANEMCPYVPFLFILMSVCDSGSLEDLLWPARASPHSTLADVTVWSLLIDIAQGLQHLHRNFVLHRDLKPSNILLTRDTSHACGLRAVLSDFGTAEITGSDTARAAHSGFTGTVEYTAPEVLMDEVGGRSGHVYSEASDLWSLGILLYAMCYNRVPYRDADPMACARLIVNDPNPIQIPQFPDRQVDLRHLIMALTTRDPAQRPSCDDILFHPSVRDRIELRYRRG